MKKVFAAVTLFLLAGGTVYAAAPETMHAIAHACGLPCC